MRNVLLAGAALCALTVAAQAADATRPYVAPTATSPKVSGDLSFHGGWYRYSNNSPYAFGGWVIGGLARANVWLNPMLSTQFDINGAHTYSSYDDTFDGGVNFAAHLSRRTQPGRLIGVMGSIGHNIYWEESFVTIAAEGQVPVGMLQLYGQVGYSTDITDGGQTHGWYVHGEARHFFNPNLMLAVNFGVVGSNEYGTHHNGIRWGLDLEKKLDASPFGFFLSYKGNTDNEPSESERSRTHSIVGGFKVHFNTDTLKGASDWGATVRDFNQFTGVNYIPLYDYL